MEKFAKKDGKFFWHATAATVDTSAEEFLAHVMLEDTIAVNREHISINGEFPRHVENHVDGSRGQHYFHVEKFSAPFSNRYYKEWRTWEKIETPEGKKVRREIKG